MKEILIWDYVDVWFSQCNTMCQPARCIIRHLISTCIAFQHPSEIHSPEYAAACEFIGKEIELTSIDIPDPDDMGYVQNWFMRQSNDE